MTQFRPCLLAAGLALLALTSCDREFEEIAINPEIAVPLFTASASVDDLFDEDTDTSELIIYPNGDLGLLYQGDILRRDASEIFQAIPPFPGVMLDTSLNFPFTLENEISLTKGVFTGGMVNAQATSNLEEDLDLLLEFPDVQQNGQPLQLTGEILYTGTLPVVVNLDPVSLAGYEITLTSLEFKARYVATRKSNGSRVTLPNVTFLISGITFSYLEGYFGYEVFDIRRDTIQMDIFDNIIQGNLAFADPRVTIIVDNAFGFPVRSQINALQVTRDQTTLQVMSPLLADGIDFNYPSLMEVGQVKETRIDFDKDNSNFRDILNIYPTTLDYDIDAIANPDEIPDLIGFTTDSAYFNIAVQVELPLFGKADGFTAEQLIDVDFSDLDNISEAEFKLVVDNQWPLEMLVQATLLDGEGNALGTLLPADSRIVAPAPVDQDGYSAGTTTQITFIPADADLLEAMRNAAQIRVDALFNTTDMGQTDVRIRQSDEIQMRMGMRATLDDTLGGE